MDKEEGGIDRYLIRPQTPRKAYSGEREGGGSRVRKERKTN